MHGGFGLLTVGNLAKPKWWALVLAQRLGDTELPVAVTGDGADSLVQAWAAKSGNTVGVLLWNGTLDHARAGGDAALARRVTVRITGLAAGAGTLRTWRVDEEHNNVLARWRAMSGTHADWPDEEQWKRLAAADRLAELPPATVRPDAGGTVEFPIELPMPGIAYLEVE
jgi:xylan 1,4-beta-xylosidase